MHAYPTAAGLKAATGTTTDAAAAAPAHAALARTAADVAAGCPLQGTLARFVVTDLLPGAAIAAGATVLIAVEVCRRAQAALAAGAPFAADHLGRVLGGADILGVAAALLARLVAVGPLGPGQGPAEVGASREAAPSAAIAAVAGLGPGGAQAQGGDQGAGEAAAEPAEGLSPGEAGRHVPGQVIEVEPFVHFGLLSRARTAGARSLAAAAADAGVVLTTA
jgi:hypothetical protein